MPYTTMERTDTQKYFDRISEDVNKVKDKFRNANEGNLIEPKGIEKAKGLHG